jgi:tetratricopeptide (TPR) repeat protein
MTQPNTLIRGRFLYLSALVGIPLLAILLVRDFGPTPGYFVAKAKAALERGDMTDAHAHLKSAFASDPQNAEALLVKGDLSLLAGDAIGAIDAYRSVPNVDGPVGLKARCQEASIFQKMLRLRDAENSLLNALWAQKHCEEVVNLLARIYETQLRARDLRVAMLTRRRYREWSLKDLATFVLAGIPGPKSAEQLEKILAADPEDHFAAVALARIERTSGRSLNGTRRLRALKPTIRRQPIVACELVCNAAVSGDREQTAEQLSTFAEILTKQPTGNDPRLWFAAGLAEACLGQTSHAIRSLENALKATGLDLESRSIAEGHLAKLYESERKSDRAKKHQRRMRLIQEIMDRARRLAQLTEDALTAEVNWLVDRLEQIEAHSEALEVADTLSSLHHLAPDVQARVQRLKIQRQKRANQEREENAEKLQSALKRWSQLRTASP